MEPHIISVLPFIFLLLSISILPYTAFDWWEKNYIYVSLGLAAVTAVYYLIIFRGWDIFRSVEEYIMFISLLTSLYVVSGGIYIGLKGYSTPIRNVIFLFLGALLSNLIGTTGASMLLIRPFIKTNKVRISAFHIIFFIFIISNIGGSLTPIGDPPLFLGYLKGIPFFWIIGKVFWQWLFVLSVLLFIFYVLDRINFKKQAAEKQKMEEAAGEKVEVKGVYNFLFLAIVIISVFISEPIFLREVIMLLAAFLSYKMTNKTVHSRNHFNFKPILEVGWLFLGIFVTMTPALYIVSRRSFELDLSTPTHYYWLTGLLSSFLDNAPTYLTFLTASIGYFGLDLGNKDELAFFLANKSVYVVSISLAAVFFGACTYIGNGPNFMVKSIADHQKLRTPSFLGYIVKYTLPILLPLYFLVWLLFIK